MQAKIIDFASDRLVKSIQKIDKNDVKRVMTNLSGKPTQEKPSSLALQPPAYDHKPKTLPSQVSSSEEYCAMLQNEFNFAPSESSKIPKSPSDKVKKDNDDNKLPIDGEDEKKENFFFAL
jgi:hypothetical protein